MSADKLILSPDRYLSRLSAWFTLFDYGGRVLHSQELVDVLAIIGPSRNVTVNVGRSSHWLNTSFGKLNPCIMETGIDENVDAAARLRIPIVHISRNNNGSTDGIGLDIGQQLIVVTGSCILVALLVACIGMQIVEVNLVGIGQLQTHECESLGSETVGLVDEALLPSNSGKGIPVELG